MLHSNQPLEIFPIQFWQERIDSVVQMQAVKALEQGKVLFFPELQFVLNAQDLDYLLKAQVTKGTKNVSYNFLTDKLRGSADNKAAQAALKKIMQRYVEASKDLIASLFPGYVGELQIGRTSLRPVEIAGRQAPSYRKDDTRLHVDAFPASPNQGRRILRVFYNYNPFGVPRVWRVGESFQKLAEYFFPKFRAPLPLSSCVLKTLKITKGVRTPYDHYMLRLHDGMKYDMEYQNKVDAEVIELPAHTAWMVYTDSVSHAALSGQHVLEQTFYLPVAVMNNPEISPLRILEKLAGRKLV